MTAAEEAARAALIETCLAMNASGINQGTSGNVSVRWGEGLLITPSALAYAAMTPADIVYLAPDGPPQRARPPSSEWRFHRDILMARPDVEAVVHCHSTFATALACHSQDIPAFHYMVAVAGGTSIRCADYATFGGQELSDAALVALRGGWPVCWASMARSALAPVWTRRCGWRSRSRPWPRCMSMPAPSACHRFCRMTR